MVLNLDAIGKKIGPVTSEYNGKDMVLYAIGIGAGFDELEYVYETQLKVIPAFAIPSSGRAVLTTSTAGVNVVFQFSISGPSGGDRYSMIRDGECTVQADTHEKPSTMLKMSDDDLSSTLAGSCLPCKPIPVGGSRSRAT